MATWFYEKYLNRQVLITTVHIFETQSIKLEFEVLVWRVSLQLTLLCVTESKKIEIW